MPRAAGHGTLVHNFEAGVLRRRHRKARMSDHEQGHAQDHGEDHDGDNIDLAFGKAVVKGALVGLPIMVVLISAAVWLITDQSVGTSIATGLLPGVLLGVFGGGFIGVLGAMEH